MSIEMPLGPIAEFIKYSMNWWNLNQYRKNYLEKISDQSKKFGRDWVPDNKYLLDMDNSYVPLSLGQEGTGPETLETVLAREHRLVIQGGPGSGKSTLVRYIMLIMAQAFLKKAFDISPKPRFGPPILFPMQIDLRICNDGSQLEDLMLNSIKDLSSRDVRHQLSKGNVLLIFDGLDEVVSMPQREIVLEQIGELSKEYSSKKNPNHFLVTTRATGYRHQILAGADFSLFTLQALSPQQQKDMLCRYYQHWNKNISLPSGVFDAQQFADDLFKQLSTNSGLIRLRNSPLMLSQIALTHYRGEKIPAVRSELYERCVLELVQRHSGHGGKASDTLLKQDYDRLVLLGGIAFLLHQRKKTDFVTLEEVKGILKLLKNTYPSLEIAEEQIPSIIDNVEHDWAILTSFRDELGRKVYKFSNLTFQEYLVARLIHESPRQNEYWSVLSQGDYFQKDWDWWCEVALLYSGLPVQQTLPADRMIEEILKNINLQAKSQTWVNAAYCLVSSRESHKVRRRLEIIDHLKNQIEEFRHPSSENALEALIQIIPDGLRYTLDLITSKDNRLVPHSDDFFELLFKINEPLSRQILRDALIAVLEHNSKYIQELRELELIHIATALSIIGDTRLGQLCKVTGKNITYRPFMIGQYPVTNAEYSNFVEETKQAFPAHWDGTKPLELSNHPVTYISLDDANDYCKWLSEKLHKKYRLPTEKEWMFMARDGQYERTWNYPWMGDLRINYLNCRSRYVGSTKTTPVGLYKDGRTPDFGIYDLLGNVWEWTSSRRGGTYATKGMAWDTVDASAGVNAVEYVAPHEKRDNLGFRILQEI